jgi:hypothetical protein
MHMRSLSPKASFPCAALFLCGLLGAQSYVSPSHFTNAEGLNNNVFPFGSAVPFRYCQVHDDVPPMLVTRLTFRHDGTILGGAIYPAYSITIDAWMSQAATTSTTTVGMFDNNHGQPKFQVVTSKQFNHPASNPTDVPGQFILDYPLDLPFPHTGTASLCWEVHTTARSTTAAIIHDAAGNTNANPALQTTPALTGCISTGRTGPMAAVGASAMNWPGGSGTLTVNGTEALANGPVLHVLGFSKTSFFGIPLPFTIPASSCVLYNDARVITASLATSTGTSSHSLTVPATPDLNGATVYSQIWGLDPTANPVGITTSNLVIHNFIAPYSTLPLTRVYLSGSLGAVGTVALGYGLVTRFR